LYIVNELRSTILWNQNINFNALTYIAIVSFCCLILGWIVFNSTKQKLAELV